MNCRFPKQKWHSSLVELFHLLRHGTSHFTVFRTKKQKSTNRAPPVCNPKGSKVHIDKEELYLEGKKDKKATIPEETKKFWKKCCKVKAELFVIVQLQKQREIGMNYSTLPSRNQGRESGTTEILKKDIMKKEKIGKVPEVGTDII